MREKRIIQKLLASLLLVLFTISFVPKTFFHDLLADHKDTVSCGHPGKITTCVHQKGYDCSFDDLVVTAPYVVQASGYNFVPFYYNTSYSCIDHSLVLPLHFYGTESRGPPSVVIA